MLIRATLGLCWGIPRAVGDNAITGEGAGLGVHATGDDVVVFFARGDRVSFRFSSPVFQLIVGLMCHSQS